MTDRELLELAAKAYGAVVCTNADGDAIGLIDMSRLCLWNPLTSDGDALRLAVKLGMQTGPNTASREPMVFAWARERGGRAEYILVGDDPYAATRRAIVRAAAEIGKAMP